MIVEMPGAGRRVVRDEDEVQRDVGDQAGRASRSGRCAAGPLATRVTNVSSVNRLSAWPGDEQTRRAHRAPVRRLVEQVDRRRAHHRERHDRERAERDEDDERLPERAPEVVDRVGPRADQQRQHRAEQRGRHEREQVGELVADLVDADLRQAAELREHHAVDAEVRGAERRAERERRGVLHPVPPVRGARSAARRARPGGARRPSRRA